MYNLYNVENKNVTHDTISSTITTIYNRFIINPIILNTIKAEAIFLQLQFQTLLTQSLININGQLINT